jgi:hypothetical protein
MSDNRLTSIGRSSNLRLGVTFYLFKAMVVRNQLRKKCMLEDDIPGEGCSQSVHSGNNCKLNNDIPGKG